MATSTEMTATQVKDALRVRHPGHWPQQPSAPGPWTVLEEWANIDVIAFSSWANTRLLGVPCPRIGYEVKVSRSDMRRELLRPHKRRLALTLCHAFYFAVPKGLLTTDELAYTEPEWEEADFNRVTCPMSYAAGYARDRDNEPGRCFKGKREQLFIGPLPDDRYAYRHHVSVACDACGGKGYAAKSRAETEAPTLWVPRDVGLIEVSSRGCRVTRKAPVNKTPTDPCGATLHDLVRWASFRPDPRHVHANTIRNGNKRVSE